MARRLFKVMLALVALVLYEVFFPPQPYSGDIDTPLPPKTPTAFRIAFGSCNDQNEPQPLWETIVQSRPDLWIWLGDNIYADTRDMDRLRNMYDQQKRHPGYVKLRHAMPVVGVWDDHDYGENGADADWPPKHESQKLFLNFMDEPDSSPRWTREGVYQTYVYPISGQRLRLILLDTRFFKKDDDMLGETQWKWLEDTLASNACDVTIIGSGTQVLRVDFWKDKWTESSKQRLISILHRHAVQNVILISGDRHHGELSMVTPPELPYPLFELTSSGLTHYKSHLWYWSGQEKNRYRVGAPYGNLNFGVIDVDMMKRQLDLYIVDQDGHARIHRSLAIERETAK